MTDHSQHKRANRLIDSTSPYLLQHAYNPVDWHPWGEGAIQKARQENKPIFLSIGYSACHWCHVMESECFENDEIAAVMNEHFINIKVDREERPDLDEIYMAAVQALTGQGGWPMSVFLTPDLKPFYGGTYFPPQDMYGRPGFPSLLQSLARIYKEQQEEISQSAEKLTQHIQKMMNMQSVASKIDYSLIENGIQSMRRQFDAQHGGFGGAPKFPHSMDLSLLLRYAYKTGDKKALQMVELSLGKMARGGMYDQLGGGFHRYSTDAKWLIPHFEKMLYDNALLAKTYAEVYQMTQNPFYERIVRETLDYVLREMTSPEGGFYSTQDADSEGREGAFFVWTPEQIAAAAGEDRAPMIRRYFGVEEGGNFEDGASALHVPHDLQTVARLFDIPEDRLWKIIQEAKFQLFQAREARVKPARDEKMLADWNGLMISAMAFTGSVFNDPKYTAAAEKAADFVLRHFQKEERLLHACKDGRAHTNGFLSDYSFLILGLLDAYEASRNPRWLEESLRLTQIMIDRFWDNDGGAFFFTADDHEKLIVRSKNPMDNAIPSGNSIAILCLLRLAAMTGNNAYRCKAAESLAVFSDGLQRIPSGFSQMLSAVDFMLDSPHEIVLAANDEMSLLPMQGAIFAGFHPNKVVMYRFPEVESIVLSLLPALEDKKPLPNAPAAYICQNFTCRRPVSTIDDILQCLNEK
ncbi:MAG: thioredoxin domain-containing protein [Candidatus Omnitrophica bacterium]|nr:thioredoxin domain-containing protein [Candidatus Omnitrophota bacterium]